ncbi:primosomal protein DnaI [Liquorilactobacillus mali]|uniref:Primosomal protein DnaI n=1 Tax=Liquorilactobacillus mali TaxID=1618 RepID=A0A0R2GBQ2_9LACO|nr:primosomal protein DnaI [Liquorilactobacillus mali]KRN34237.1 primosomal protein DnaI [Liquorilactobacillus mali]MDN7144327.1 primosomal protein DnaI [Liquorilactobacillus mali]
MKDVGEEMAQQLRNRNWIKNYKELIDDAFADEEVKAFVKENQLSQTELARSASKVYEFVSIKRQIKNGEVTPAPGYQPQLILSNHLIDVAYVPSEELMKSKKQAEIRARVRTLNMPKAIRTAQLADFDITGREAIAQAAADFIDTYTANPQKFIQGMYLQGSFGVGKTYLLGAIANGLAEEGFRSTMLHFPSFAVEVKGAIGSNNVVEKIDSIKKAPVLMLDDIGADQLSSWLRDDVLGIILQYRMQEELPTFFSSNLSMQDLLEQYLTVNNRGEAEPLKARRIMERIVFLSKEYTMIGRNRRHS